MQQRDPGIQPPSETFFFSPSDIAKQLYYYLTSCGYFYCTQEYLVRRENYGNYLLLYVQKGTLSVSSEGRTHTVEAGEAAFINCHQPHEYGALCRAEFVWAHFDGAQTAALHRYITGALHGDFKFAAGPQLHRDLEQLTQVNSRDQLISEAEYSQYIYDMLFGIIVPAADLPGASRQNAVVKSARDYILANLGGSITVEEIAAQAEMSKYHFSRFFKKTTGISPYEYVLLCRVNKAKHLLKSTTRSIEEIAYSVGYNSVSNFIHSFEKKVGQTPGQFRRFPI